MRASFNASEWDSKYTRRAVLALTMGVWIRELCVHDELEIESEDSGLQVKVG